MTTAATHCPYCALQCGMQLSAGGPEAPNEVVITPRDFPTNRGGLCQKGWTAGRLLRSPERLTTPLVRDGRDRPFRPASWDAALDLVAERVKRIQHDHGLDAVGVLGGGGLTNEKAYLLGKFARVALQTSTIDYNGRFCMSSAAAAGNRAFGVDRGLPFPLTDLADTGAILLAGGNLAETMPPLMQHVTAMRDRGGALVVIDPRRTPTAEQAALHLQPSPGTDLALALGLLHAVVAEGYADLAYLDGRTTGFDEVWQVAATWWPERVERVTGVPAGQQRAAVRLLGAAARGQGAVILTGRGAEQHSKGTDTATAFINLALTLGLPGRPASGYGCVTGQGNGQGGREHGQKADQLPGYRRIDDPAARAHVARVWGVPPESLPGPGPSAYELLAGLGSDGGARALLVHGTNPAVSAPQVARICDRLARLDLLVVSDLVLSETAAMADVVLPVAQWAEEDGTMTNLEGRVIRRRALSPPPAGVRTDLEVLAGLAARLGHHAGFPVEPRAAFDELRRASAGGPADYSGITWDRIDSEEGVFWPCPDEDHPGTPRIFTERFATVDGRARLVPVDHRPVDDDIDAAYPVYLTSGRVLQHYQSGAQTRRIAELAIAVPDPLVEMCPDLAERHDLTEGDLVRVVSRRGSAVGRVRLSVTIRPDTIFMPFHWGGAGSVNRVTNPALDPVSRMPEFKVCAVTLEKAPEEAPEEALS